MGKSTFFRTALAFLALGAPAFAQDALPPDVLYNGVERDGGVVKSQEFPAAANEAMVWFERWKDADPAGYALTKLSKMDFEAAKRILNDVIEHWEVRFTKSGLDIDNVPKDAVHTYALRLIEMDERVWLAIRDNPVKRLSFPLHEYLHPARRRDARLDDRKYQITSHFEAWLGRVFGLAAFKQEITGRISAHARLLHQSMDPTPFKGIANQFKILQGTTDFDDCTAPKTRVSYGETYSSNYPACLGVAIMIHFIERNAVALSEERLKERETDAEFFQDLDALFEKFSARSHMTEAEIEKAKRRIRKLVSELSAASAASPALISSSALRESDQTLMTWENTLTTDRRFSLADRARTDMGGVWTRVIRELETAARNHVATFPIQCPGTLQESVKCLTDASIQLFDVSIPSRLEQARAELRTVLQGYLSQIDGFAE